MAESVPPRSPFVPTRRDFLRYSGLTAAAGATGTFGALAVPTISPSLAPRAFGTEGVDYTARATFDAWDVQFHQPGNAGQPDQPNDESNVDGRSGMLSWSQSYALAGLVRMYETYGDTRYLDRLIENTDQVLGVRDSERGVTDYRGESLPAWRANHPYTVGITALADDQGRPTLEVRCARSYAGDATVNVQAGSASGTFDLRVVRGGTSATVRGLTMDPASPDYAIARFYRSSIGSQMLTVRDLRESPAAAGNPALGAFPMVCQPVIFAVHTGMITYPMASFVRIVRRTPTLNNDPTYRAKADEYLEAVRAAVAVHDWEYRENERGEGFYIWPKGQPLAWDGCEQPTNQSLAIGQTIVELAAITGEETYRRRASALARMFAAQVQENDAGAYTWSYWMKGGLVYEGFRKTGSPETDISLYTPEPVGGRGSRQMEDISHGAIAVEFAVRAFQEKLGFTGYHMSRLARTFTENISITVDGLPGVSTRVDGSGVGSASVAHQVPRWMLISPWDEQVHNHALALYDRYEPTPEKDGDQAISFGWLLANVANLNMSARNDY